MALFPVRHPQKDFFVLDIADVVPKDDTASMEHPIFSLATKADMRVLHYQGGNNALEIRPSYQGLPTIFDKDILIFCISHLIHLKNQGKPIGKRVRFSARELLIATNRKTGGNSYQRLEAAFSRLQGTQFKTTVGTGGKVETRFFSLVDEGGFVMKDDFSRLDYCEVVLSDWLMRAIEASEVVSISPDYFRLRRPLERRLYELCRKHCGVQPRWRIGLDVLHRKTGSLSRRSEFLSFIRKTVKKDNIPDYVLRYDESTEMVYVRPIVSKIKRELPLLNSEEQTFAVVASMVNEKYEPSDLLNEWLGYWTDTGCQSINNPDAAFTAWVRKNKVEVEQDNLFATAAGADAAAPIYLN